ncbi:MAG: hypothetical protein MJZ02_06200 [Paludibacteraceae bacterium]|nr:hypothetical protein [Paludibacteraceae bacterium]
MGLRDLFFKDDDKSKNSANELNDGATRRQSDAAQNTTSYSAPEPQQNSGQQEVHINPDLLLKDSAITSENGEVSEAAMKQLWQIMTDRNLPGPDMLELKNFAASLESTGMPKDKRYEAAFLMLSSQYPSFNKATLLASVDTYIGYVKEEQQNGRQQFNQKKQMMIGDQLGKLESMKQEAASLKAQIEELQKKYDSLQTAIGNMDVEISNSTKSIAHDEEVFNNTINHFIGELENEKVVMSNLNIK